MVNSMGPLFSEIKGLGNCSEIAMAVLTQTVVFV